MGIGVLGTASKQKQNTESFEHSKIQNQYYDYHPINKHQVCLNQVP
jgi:hypothetical protein